ncbi:hypothetical protein GCM10007391_32500 [Alteromonas halophila]|uniref:Succinylglutamate desuccinylase/Aspartoacylase catalytic domain-containing protein n=1 Tax=Alteromonas halophila TaxID=516698 RepID=A0A918N0W4_9ALTE|nr:hypothetical protein GCM10007391_32500 [Alteromonas halophila]
MTLHHITDVYSAARKRSLEGFLLSLGGPSLLTFLGLDSSRCRVVVTLLHGNEPSGLRAVLALAQERLIPAVTCHVIIASTAAAATRPRFSHRMLPGQEDLNRCFGPGGESAQFQLAGAIKACIAKLNPECVVDLHNTSGSGPDFSVSISGDNAHQALASCFTSRMIVTDLRLGSLMEQSFSGPVVTIEAGGAKDALADETAVCGLRTLFTEPDIYALKHRVELLHYPRRLELQPGSTIAYLDGPDSATSVCLRTDIESLNFGYTPAGTHLGWVRENGLSDFRLDDRRAELSSYFCVEDHCLFTAVPLQLFMVTTIADIARSDCLFYFIHEKR